MEEGAVPRDRILALSAERLPADLGASSVRLLIVSISWHLVSSTCKHNIIQSRLVWPILIGELGYATCVQHTGLNTLCSPYYPIDIHTVFSFRTRSECTNCPPHTCGKVNHVRPLPLCAVGAHLQTSYAPSRIRGGRGGRGGRLTRIAPCIRIWRWTYYDVRAPALTPDITYSKCDRPGTHAHATAQRRRGPNPELSPLSASAYFAQATQIDVQASGLDVRAYHTAPRVSGIGEAGTVMVCHHGAGQSALTFALMAGEITDLSGGACGMLALDCRGHGASAIPHVRCMR